MKTEIIACRKNNCSHCRNTHYRRASSVSHIKFHQKYMFLPRIVDMYVSSYTLTIACSLNETTSINEDIFFFLSGNKRSLNNKKYTAIGPYVQVVIYMCFQAEIILSLHTPRTHTHALTHSHTDRHRHKHKKRSS